MELKEGKLEEEKVEVEGKDVERADVREEDVVDQEDAAGCKKVGEVALLGSVEVVDEEVDTAGTDTGSTEYMAVSEAEDAVVVEASAGLDVLDIALKL